MLDQFMDNQLSIHRGVHTVITVIVVLPFVIRIRIFFVAAAVIVTAQNTRIFYTYNIYIYIWSLYIQYTINLSSSLSFSSPF